MECHRRWNGEIKMKRHHSGTTLALLLLISLSARSQQQRPKSSKCNADSDRIQMAEDILTGLYPKIKWDSVFVDLHLSAVLPNPPSFQIAVHERCTVPSPFAGFESCAKTNKDYVPLIVVGLDLTREPDRWAL